MNRRWKKILQDQRRDFRMAMYGLYNPVPKGLGLSSPSKKHIKKNKPRKNKGKREMDIEWLRREAFRDDSIGEWAKKELAELKKK